MISVVLNGEPIRLQPGISVARLVQSRLVDVRGVAVAVNAEVVPRSAWAATELADGDRVEIVSAAKGG
jgi:sulfur carrier protein